MTPQVDERVDVVVERIGRRDVQDPVQKDVRLERPHEEQRRRARVANADDARLGGAAEVALDDVQAAAGRTVGGLGVERDDERGLGVHVDRDVQADHFLGEGDELLGDAAQHEARVGARVNLLQVGDDGRQAAAAGHGLEEELLLRLDVAQERGGGDAELSGDVGQGGVAETLGGEDAAGDVQEPIAGDGGRASHL